MKGSAETQTRMLIFCDSDTATERAFRHHLFVWVLIWTPLLKSAPHSLPPNTLSVARFLQHKSGDQVPYSAHDGASRYAQQDRLSGSPLPMGRRIKPQGQHDSPPTTPYPRPVRARRARVRPLS